MNINYDIEYTTGNANDDDMKWDQVKLGRGQEDYDGIGDVDH